jgi:hypothetical protein
MLPNEGQPAADLRPRENPALRSALSLDMDRWYTHYKISTVKN